MLTITPTTRSNANSWSLHDHVLAVVDFDANATTPASDPRCVTIPLAASGTNREIWTSPEPVQTTGQIDDLRFARTRSITMGSIVLPDTESDVEHIAERLYSTLLEGLGTVCHRHLWRVWNYFPRITHGHGDRERYRRFSVGRARALCAAGIDETTLPPATAIGTQTGPWVVTFVAGEMPCRPIENPRQLSAYRYPRQYGPVSPSFARAALVGHTQQPSALIVSGTASIVGHETRHPARWPSQLNEIRQNISSLLSQAEIEQPPSHLRLYARPHLPLEAIQAALGKHWGSSVPTVALQGDICRPDLLLEVEGWWSLRT